MNRLRKIARWLWLSKERMVLAVMVGFLCYRVYQVMYPETTGEGNEGQIWRLASKDLPEDMERPGTPPLPPPNPLRVDWSRLWKSPMFRWDPRGVKAPGGLAEVELSVIKIMDTGVGGYRVQIETEKSKKWYAEGASFESYELISIDPDGGCCDIFAENIQKLVEVCIED